MQEYFTIVGTQGVYEVEDKPVEFATREDAQKILDSLDRNVWLNIARNERPTESVTE